MTAFFAGQTNHIALLNQLATRNVLINSGFQVNQRGYVSAAVLAAAAYGHDRWKAGASGGDYSFVSAANVTAITIAASKSLIQVIEDKNVEGGQYVLSWTGTAQARAGVNSATPSGSYASSPIVIASQSAGTTMSVEFNAGTLSKPKLELATADPTDWQALPFSHELLMCQRYLPAFTSELGINDEYLGFATSTTVSVLNFPFRTIARVPPTGITVSSAAHFSLFSWKTAATGAPSSLAFNIAGPNVGAISVTTVAGTPTLAQGDPVALVAGNVAARILFTGCEL